MSKYDEEISGKTVKKSFEIGAGGQYDEDEAIRQERERIRQKLNRKMVESLEMPAPRVASDFLTAEESAVKFKKMKKKKKVKRKMLKADDLLGLGDLGGDDDDEMHVDGDVEPVETKSVKPDDEVIVKKFCKSPCALPFPGNGEAFQFCNEKILTRAVISKIICQSLMVLQL